LQVKEIQHFESLGELFLVGRACQKQGVHSLSETKPCWVSTKWWKSRKQSVYLS